MNKFEPVARFCDGDKIGVRLPTRATAHSAGYDFSVSDSIVVPSIYNIMEHMDGYIAKKVPYQLKDFKSLTKSLGLRPTLVPTGVKCQLDDDKYLELSVRSSTPLSAWLVLANGVGIIDSDYYNNSDNEGEIFFQLINLSPVDIVLQPGDVIGQGIIKSYGLTDNDQASGVRAGGLGSTHE